MLKKACVFSLIVTSTIVSFASRASADSLLNTQNSSQEAAAVGDNNQIRQLTNQFNLINWQQPLIGNVLAPSDVISSQSVNQAAGAVGMGNQIEQRSDQFSLPQLISKPASFLPKIFP